MDSKLSASKLRKKIKERRDIINRIVEFSEKLVLEIGEQTHYDETSSCISITRKLDDFGGFSFTASSSQSNFLHIWDGPKLEYGPTVFAITYWGVWPTDNFKVEAFEEKGDWLPRFYRLMNRKDEIIREMGKKKKLEEGESRLKAQKEEQMINLLTQAKKLGIKVQ
jgi:hypothetical protein